MAEVSTALIATFDDPDTAGKWLKHAHDEGYDVAEGIVLNRDEGTGKIHKHLANLPGVAVGAGTGAIIGALLGILFPPALLGEALIAAIGVGAAGAAVGAGGVAIKDEIVDRNAFKDVAENLEPGQSALVIVLAPEDAVALDAEITGHIMKSMQELGAA